MKKIEMPGHTWVAITMLIWFMMGVSGIVIIAAGSITLKFKDVEFELVSESKELRLEQVREARELRDIVENLRRELSQKSWNPETQVIDPVGAAEPSTTSSRPRPTPTPRSGYGSLPAPTPQCSNDRGEASAPIDQKEVLEKYEQKIRDFEQRALDTKNTFTLPESNSRAD